MLEVSHDVVTAGEEQLVSCAAKQSKYFSICTLTLDPCGVTSWGRWQCRRGGADCLHGCYAVCGCGTKYRCGALLGVTYGDMLEAMARITPSQPNDAMARIASRRNRTISLDPNLPGQISERFFRDSLDKIQQYKKTTTSHARTQKPQFYVQPSSDFCWIPPVVRRLFEVNSEPHTGARPSVRLCVGPELACCVHHCSSSSR